MTEKEPEGPNPEIVKIFSEQHHEYKIVNIMTGATLDAEYDSVQRFATPREHLCDEEVAHSALLMLEAHFTNLVPDSDMCTLEEAVDDSDFNKNPGMPWSILHPTKGHFWNWMIPKPDGWDDGVWFTICSYLGEDAFPNRQLARSIWEGPLLTGDWQAWMSVSIKRELRAIAKVLSGRVRTIIMMCVLHILFSKMFTLRLFKSLIRIGWRRTWIFLGFKPYYGGMNRFAQYLSQFQKGSV